MTSAYIDCPLPREIEDLIIDGDQQINCEFALCYHVPLLTMGILSSFMESTIYSLATIGDVRRI